MRLLPFIFFIYLNSINVLGQVDKSATLTSIDGLSENTVFTAIQSKEGFIYAGTKNGLNRYDGKQVKLYTHDAFDPWSLGGNGEIGVLYQDTRGLIWIVSHHASLDVFDPTTERFYHIKLDAKEKEMTNYYLQIIEDKQGAIWLAYNTGLIERFIIPEDFPINYQQPIIAKDSLLSFQIQLTPEQGYITDFLPTKTGEIYTVSSGGAFFKVESESPDIKLITNLPLSNEIDQRPRLFETTNQSILIVGDKANEFFKFEKNKVRQIPDFLPKGYYRFDIFAIDKENVGIKSGEYFWKIPANYLVIEQKDWSLATYWKLPYLISTPFTDAAQNIWLPTLGYGLFKSNAIPKKFEPSLKKTSLANVFGDKAGRLWLFDKKGFDLTKRPLPKTIKELPFLEHYSYKGNIAQGDKDVIWMMGVNKSDNQKDILRIEKGEVTKTYDFPYFLKSDIFHHFYFDNFLLVDHQNQLWIIGENMELINFNPETAQFKIFKDTANLSQAFSSYVVTDFKQDTENNFLLATRFGLLKIKYPTVHPNYSYELIQNDPKNQTSLSANHITSLAFDPTAPEKYLWMGTFGGGVNKMDLITNQFVHFTKKDGLPDNIIQAIIFDDEGTLWMSSFSGLAQFKPDSKDIINYTISDGLQAKEFHPNAVTKLPDGKLVFGGYQGLNIFSPTKINQNKYIPPVKITALYINNKLVTTKFKQDKETAILEKGIEFTEAIELDWQQNQLKFEFAALDFNDPAKILFQYQLEGVNPTWVKNGNQNTVQFNSLVPGNYIFKVKASNSDGLWNETPTTLSITIHAPWWKTTLAYLAYFLIFLSGLYLLYQNQIRRATLKNQLAYEQKEGARLLELDSIKSNFFSNITHEFRTPLTVILGLANQLMTKSKTWNLPQSGKEEILPRLNLIHRNGQNLLELVNQLLDLSKLESGKMSLNLVHGDAIKYINYLLESFHSLAETKNIRLHFLPEQEGILMDYDPDKLMNIIANLLSNAIKFTPQNGDIYVHLDIDKVSHEQSFLKIRVKDNGVGIAKAQLPFIFDRFYQTDSSSTRKGEGTGIGLALVKELVQFLGGDITVTSILNKGTTFMVTLPIQIKEETLSETTASTEGGASEKVTIIPDLTEKLALQTSINKETPTGKETLLLIEDNKDVAYYIQSCLAENYEIIYAENGQLGIDSALENVPDIIISDVMMPEKDGFEVLQALKNDERTSHIPIILLTAKADETSKLLGLKGGADAYLSKPFNEEELLIRLASMVQLRKELQQRYSHKILDSTNFLTTTSVSKSQQIEKEFLTKLYQLFEKNLSNTEYDMTRLCRDMGRSRSQLFRKIKALTGKSPTLLFRGFRLLKGKELLQTTDLSVSEIAYEVGFTSMKYFSDAFLEEFNIRPSATRN